MKAKTKLGEFVEEQKPVPTGLVEELKRWFDEAEQVCEYLNCERKRFQEILSLYESPAPPVQEESLAELAERHDYRCEIKSDGMIWDIILQGMRAGQNRRVFVAETYLDVEQKARAFLNLLPDSKREGK